jgi:Metallo-beta-lactamase superfamily
MKEIVPDVLTWSRPSERHGYDFNSYLVRHPDGNLCIDPVEPSDAVLEQIAGMGATRILLTNRNHTRAANLLRSRLAARTAIHRRTSTTRAAREPKSTTASRWASASARCR